MNHKADTITRKFKQEYGPKLRSGEVTVEQALEVLIMRLEQLTGQHVSVDMSGPTPVITYTPNGGHA